MQWTPERVELLKQMWGNGLTAAQIAEKLGGITRNAVIGKANRLGLSKGGKPRHTRPRAPHPPQRRPPPELTAPPPPPPPPEPDIDPEELPWSRRCQWPIGHPGDPGFRFCGAAAQPSKPYCWHHCTLAYRHKDEAA